MGRRRRDPQPSAQLAEGQKADLVRQAIRGLYEEDQIQEPLLSQVVRYLGVLRPGLDWGGESDLIVRILAEGRGGRRASPDPAGEEGGGRRERITAVLRGLAEAGNRSPSRAEAVKRLRKLHPEEDWAGPGVAGEIGGCMRALRKEGVLEPVKGGRRAGQAGGQRPAPAPKPAGAKAELDLIGAVGAVKELGERLGWDQLLRLVEILRS